MTPPSHADNPAPRRHPEQAHPHQSALDRLTDEFAKLPSIGRKTAEKLAYHILRATPAEARALADAVIDVKENVFACSICFNLTEIDPCPICRDEDRDRHRLCVVEQPRDLHAIEKTGTYNGLYHVLTGRVMLLDGVTPDDLTLGALRARVERSHLPTAEQGPIAGLDPEDMAALPPEEPITEVILATNPDYEGDGTALYVRDALDRLPVEITQLARGIPQGASIEFVSTAILADALRSRRSVAADAPDHPGQH